MAKLILIRHGQSQWNLDNRFTGWIDIDLTNFGREEARSAGRKIKEIKLDYGFTSVLRRAIETLQLVLAEADQIDIPVIQDQALNERHYGDLQGLDKTETAEKFGAEQVKLWRRSYDVPPPNGESLKMTASRTLPFFESEIMPKVYAEENVVVSAHGNSLRAIMMSLDKLSEEEVVKLEIPNGIPIVYDFQNRRLVAKNFL